MKFWFLALLVLLLSPWAPAQEANPAVFSGKTQVYEDTTTGFRMDLPIEFQLTGRGANTTWEGPKVDDFATSIFVNVTPMPGVHPQAIYDGVVRSKKNDKTAVEVRQIKMPGKLKGKPIYAFRFLESPKTPGTNDDKAPQDHHRWFLYVYGNDSAYELCMAGSYQALGQGKELPEVYLSILKSFRLIEIKP
ncbi:MAG: hypothetical protein J0I12_10750 [Candidatus Eremiobacteraeota bacterium]|mgnify:CR=1 FL=1|nr:hypothetical protein [Candidatus Eremiobacteraeota bacterium]